MEFSDAAKNDLTHSTDIVLVMVESGKKLGGKNVATRRSHLLPDIFLSTKILSYYANSSHHRNDPADSVAYDVMNCVQPSANFIFGQKDGR